MRDRYSPGVESPQSDVVVLGMVDDRDRTLLADWLATIPQYHVNVFDADDPLPADYDICLLDPPTLAAFRDELLERDRAAEPIYLPHVLLDTAADDSPTVDARPTEGTTATLVDDVFALPIEKGRLHRRVENLLQTRRASRRLAEREEQYRELVALTPESILLVDDGIVVYANAAAADLFDTDDPSDLHGRALADLVRPGDSETLDAVLGDLADLADADQPTSAADFTDVSFDTAAGRRVHAAVTGVTVTFDGDRVVQLVVRDLTEQHRRQERLDLFGRAIEAADQGITIADAQQPDYPIVYANDGFERITGYPLDDVLGRNCRFLQGANTDADAVAALRDGIERGVPVSQDILNYRKDGTAFWNRVDVVPIEDDNGTVTHYLGFQRDVTDRRQREQRLSVLNRVLRHNLRNKLSLILGYADTIEHAEADTVDAAAEIHSAAESLLDISEQVREFDTVLSASHDGTRDFDIAAVVTDAADRLRERHSDIDLTVTTADDAHVAGHPALPTAIEDLLALLDDADDPAATVTVHADDTYVYLDVIDHGGAIPDADLEVVERDAETSLEHLEGVQLWLLRWTVEQSRGEITVDVAGDDPVIHLQFASSPDAERNAGDATRTDRAPDD